MRAVCGRGVFLFIRNPPEGRDCHRPQAHHHISLDVIVLEYDQYAINYAALSRSGTFRICCPVWTCLPRQPNSDSVPFRRPIVRT
ncbi:hypothetical protein NPIL_547681 [Nephila pilipes]|uniref:Uncharacterized protein n=1 Tax=Nephila pilipes TaxID=299642 RepID=A0A8X6U6T2_NEPPI|nr:hypothetical protein NPIL_547681 [Nephila pilipes]